MSTKKRTPAPPAKTGIPKAVPPAGSDADNERARLVEALELAASEWRMTFDAVEMPLVIINGDATIGRINRAARMLAGREYSEIVGHSLGGLGPEEPWVSLSQLSQAVLRARSPEAKQVTDSSGRTFDLLAMLLNLDEPQDERVIVIAWDVTALIDLQKHVDQQRTMATLGALVAGVAHEVRNPLFAISATIDALEQAAPPHLEEYFSVLREEIDRMTELMQDLLAYGRRSSAPFQELSIEAVIDSAIRGSSALAQRSSVTIRKSGNDAPVVGDRERLSRAIQNLIDNAIQHSPASTVVEVSVRTANRGRSRYIDLCVRDHGAGFSADDVTRVFEPFFSKRKGGTGLGLSLVQQIVTEHGGEVSARNADGGGGEVRVSLPVA